MSVKFQQPLLNKSRAELTTFNPLEIRYDNLNVIAEVKKKKKVILHNQSGVMKPGTFTVILGPSGSGKTTLLNFLAGRLVANNLFTYGSYYLNGNKVRSVEPYANQIGYIMQEDTLLGTMTPKENFLFCANMRLKLSKQQREARVEKLIKQLGLTGCCDTKIGNNLIKGISGGEKKRTSIGIDLITNPSIVFLDEPTTGLDSTTALQVILLLRKLANDGRTIVSTIHQPSSEVFNSFDKLLLLVDGRCIYQGDSKAAQPYFTSMGYECPILVNSAQYFMDLMSFHGTGKQSQEDTLTGQDQKLQYEQAKAQHEKTIIKFQRNYKQSLQYKELMSNTGSVTELVSNDKDFNVSGWKQFGLLFQRSFTNQLRNPFDATLKLVQGVFTSCILLIIFGRVNTTDKNPNIDGALLQNIRGIVFFIVSNCTFNGIQGTLATFSGQKPIFLRERFCNTYSTASYFWGRSLANLPFQILYPTIPSIIIFWVTGLNHNDPWNFPIHLLIVNALFFCSASYGLFYSIILPRLQTAMALVPVLIIPFMMLSGFFINLSSVPKVFYPIQYLSPFRFGYQATMLNQYNGKPLYETYIPDTRFLNVIYLVGLGLFLRTAALLMMYVISNPKRPKINEPLELQELKTIIVEKY